VHITHGVFSGIGVELLLTRKNRHRSSFPVMCILALTSTTRNAARRGRNHDDEETKESCRDQWKRGC
jgi:hypothetical protein